MKFDSPSSDFPNQLVKTELEREEFLDFLEELATIEPNGQYLTFSDSNKYVVNIKSMLIRDCYVSLCDRLIELILRDNVVSDNNHRIHITGTTGIGKTAFIVYMMWRLLKHPAKPAFVYSSLRTCGLYFYCTGSSLETWKHAPPGRHIIRLVDDHECFGALKLTPSPVILVTTPRSTNFHQFNKFKPLHKFYLSVWSLNELLSCAQANEMNKQAVSRLYDYFGGIPRTVFSPEPIEDQVKELDALIHRFEMKELNKYAVETHKNDDIGTLLHIQADSNFKLHRVVIASPFIRDMLQKTSQRAGAFQEHEFE